MNVGQSVLWIVCLAACCVSLGCSMSAQTTSTTDAQWVKAYSADLKNPTAANDQWWNASGDFKIAGEKLVLTPSKRGNLAAYVFTPRFPGSVRVEAVVSAAPAKPENLVFNLLLNDNAPVGTHPRLGYSFRLGAKDNTCCMALRGEKAVEGSDKNQVRLTAGKPVSIVAEQDGGRLTLSVDGKQVFSVKDDKPLEARGLDLVGLSAKGCTLTVEKFAVYTRAGRENDVVRPMSVPKTGTTQLTLIGPAQCARSFAAKPDEVDHDVIMYGLDGSAQIKAEFDAILEKYFPEKAMDLAQAKKFNQMMDERLKYHLVPNALTTKMHEDIDYPSVIFSVTGTAFERDGQKWLFPTKVEPAKYTFPAKMLAADQPTVMPDGQTLDLKIADGLSLKCIKIPAGKFLCGSPFYEHPRWQDEFPHEVTLTKPYYMAETLVTQEMFEKVVGTNPSKQTPTEFNNRYRHKKPDENPNSAVESPTFADIEKFCKALSQANGKTVRLPTDAEWEWAARVGNSGPCFHEKYLQQRSFAADGEGRCEPVKSRKPNAWGLYDMVKTGWELVSDYKLDNIRENQTDPKGPARAQAADHGNGPLQRTKGGAFYDDTHLNMHGACDKKGDNEEGLMVFRVVVEVDDK